MRLMGCGQLEVWVGNMGEVGLQVPACVSKELPPKHFTINGSSRPQPAPVKAHMHQPSKGQARALDSVLRTQRCSAKCQTSGCFAAHDAMPGS